MATRFTQGAFRIIFNWPPNIEEIKKVFNLDGIQSVFAYNGVIYNPYKGEIDKHLFAHESTHFKQQEESGGSENWWNYYLSDKDFRLSQEVEAYHNQYKSFLESNKDRNDQDKFLTHIAKDLSSKMYGNIISYSEAKKLIKNEKKNI